jgi:fimbrial chaperone protein
MKRLLLVLLALGSTSALWGLTLEPLTQEFAPTGRQAIRTYRVTNTQEQPVAVRLYMTTRRLTVEGKEEREDASELLLIFPARMILEPGQSQAVRVQWRGGVPEDRELAFRFIAEQVPVRGGEGRAGLQLNFTYRYEASVYVLPERDVSSEVLLSGLTALPGIEEGRQQVLLRFENRGGRHAIIGSPRVTLNRRDRYGNRESVVLDETDLDRLAGRNLLAGSAIHQPVYLPASWDMDEVEASLSFEELR